MSLSLQDLLSTGRHFLGVEFVTRLMSNLHAPLKTENTTENNRIISHVKTQLHFSQMHLNWNTSATGHKQKTVGFPQCKPMPRSTSNSSVSMCTCHSFHLDHCKYSTSHSKIITRKFFQSNYSLMILSQQFGKEHENSRKRYR
jgi:hypothetical protein